jgi:hypothetical protein
MRRVHIRPRRRIDPPSHPHSHSGGPILSSSQVAQLLAELKRGVVPAAQLAQWNRVPIAVILMLKDDLRRGEQP